MSKQLNVNLAFTADTTQAKQQLQQLQQDLSKLSLTMGTGQKLGFTKEIQEATTAAAQLQVQLKNATNVNTGKLDLGKFNESLSKSGMSLAKYQKQLNNLGPDGSRAFAQLAQAITNAEIPLRRTGILASNLWATLKNTARWQISSSMLHGFMGAVSTAYGYAKDLNESLNNIRIVTGASVEEMDKFAEKANKAAKALNTTTTAYTDAALIYYQQGLSGEAVEKRTDTTVKLANITKESSETVSEWMTAIWNNFDDGSKSLEHYADVLTKLGADTASSADEIAGGLEKFAAVSRTVGLDYENAAAALATITATTRQSEDVVGTALKTIFARIESLNLGETLEDGTTLGKYSESLMKVGVNIKEQNGSLKDMNQIIDETGQKWKTLNKDEQIALAQNVAGIRQYNQFIALMDNYDFYQENLENAKNATGALNEQSEIYAESWEASSKRVKASLESIYSSSINDDFFIDLNNFFAGFFDIIDNTIDSLGGLKGVLLLLGTIVTQVFQKQIAASLSHLAYNLKMSTNAGRESLIEMKRDANKQLVRKNFDQDTTSSRAAGIGYEAQGNAQIEYINNAERMSQEEQQISQHLLDRIRLMGDLVAKSGEELEKAEDLSAELQRQISLKKDVADAAKATISKASSDGRQVGNLNAADKIMYSQAKNIDFGETDAKKAQASIQGLKQTVNSLKQGYDDCGIELETAFGENAETIFNKLQSELNKSDIDLEEIKQAWSEWTNIVIDSTDDFNTVFDDLIKDGSLTKEKAEELKAAFSGVGQKEGELATQTGKLNTMGEGLKRFFRDAKGEAMSMSTAITQIASTLMSFGMIVSSITGLINTWKDSEASLTDKLSATAMTLGMVVPSLVSVVKGFKDAGNAVTIFGVKTSLAMWQVTLIAAAIAALIGLFVAMGQAAYKASPEGVFKSAKAAAEDAATAAQKVKEEYDNIKTSLDNLKSGIETIETMERGTIEWRKAINDSNASLIELLDTYGKLNADNFYVDDDGLMHLKEGVEEEIVNTADQYTREAQNAEYATKVSANNAENRVEAAQTIGKEVAIWRSSGNTSYDAAGENDQLSSNIGMAIADAINDGTLLDLSSTEDLKTALSEVAGLTEYEIETVAQQIASNGDLQSQMYELSNTVAANTEANRVLNNQIIQNNFGDQIEADESLDKNSKGLLTDVMGKKLEAETTTSYEDTYKDQFGGKTDAEVQEEYAKAMGWATDTIDNQSGNKAKYYKKDGTEVGVISDETARKYLAQQEALKNLDETYDQTSQNVKKFANKEEELANQFEKGQITYDEYVGGLKKVQDELGMTEQETEAYISTQGNAIEAVKKYNIAQQMMGWSEVTEMKLDKNAVSQFVNGLTEGMNNEQLQIVLDVLAESESLAEFSREIEAAMNEGALKGIQDAATKAENIVSDSVKNNNISESDTQTLLADENFQVFLQEKQMSELQFTQEHYSNKLSIISEYYAQMKALEGEQLQSNKESYQDDLAAYQAVLDAKQAEKEGRKEDAEKIAESVGIDLQLYADMDITDIQSKMDEIQNRIDELNGQQIKLDMEWESTDAIEEGIKKTAKFAKFVDKDMKKVGNSYQVTAASAREMAEVYPEIFAEAKVTTDGLIELNVDEVNGFIEGQDAKSDAAIEANKANIESRIAELEAEKEAMQADLEIAKAMAEGEMKLDGASKEYLQETRANLTQFYIDSGVDEVNANKLALETMGYNEEQYSEAVANAASRNAENQAEGAEQGANKTVKVLKSLKERFTSFFSGIGQGWKLLLEGKFKEAWAAVMKGASSTKEVSVDTNVDLDAYDSNGKFKGVDQSKRTAVMKEVGQKNLDALTKSIADIDRRIGNMKAELAYNDALQNQDLSDYGEKGVGNVSDKNSNKSVEEMIEDAERYHEITRAIEAQERALDNLGKAKDRAFGDKKIKLISQELSKLDELEQTQQDLIDAQKVFLSLDKAEVQENFANAQFDKSGNISNYSELQASAIAELNKAKEKYNKSDQTEADKDALDKAQDLYDQKISSLEQYEETLDKFNDAVDEQAETARKKLDLQLEGIQYIVDVQIEVNDRDLKVLERLLDRLEDDLYDGTERIANMTKQIDEQFDNIEIYKAGIRQTLVSAGAGQSAVDAYMAGDSTAVQGLNLTEEQMQMLQDYTDGIMESEDAILELREEIENQTMATFDAWHEKIEKNGQAFEHATTMAESYKNIIDLVGKTRLKLDNSILKDLEETQMNAMTESMRNTKAQMDTTQNALNKAKEELEKARQRGNQEDIEKWEQDIETLNKTLMEDQENFVSSWGAALQQAADIFTDQMDRAFEELEDDLAGTFKSFDELSAAMDRQQQVSDRFMDAGKKQYELSKLNRKLQQDLDKTDNVKAQRELLKLQKEIEGYQESGVEMSERDLTALQKKYELRLAEIALEDAQNAKSQVRLTRDSKGNFGYVYTADESKVADAQQNYEDKLEENRQLAIEQNQQLSEAIVNNRQAMVEALREIRQEDYADTEAYMQALQETTQFYKDQEAYLISEAQKVIERSQDIYANDYLAYDGWNLQKLDSANNYNTILSDTQLQAYEQMGINTDGWVTQETETMQQLGINILDRIMNGDGASGINGIMEALGSAEDGSGFFGASRIAAEAWASSYAEIMGQAGITIDNYGNEVATVLGPDGTQKSFSDFSSAVQYALYGEGTKTKPADGSVNGAVEAAKAKTIEYAATAQEKFGAIANSVTTWQSTYSGKIKTATQDTNNLNTAIKNLLGEKIELITNIKEVQSDINKLKATIEGLGDKTFTINHNTNNTITTEYKTIGDAPNSGTQGDGIPQVGDTVTFESGVYTADSYGGGSSGSWGRGGAMKISLITDTNRARPYHLTTTSGGARGWVSLSQISGYDTGGYTGEWGPDGKLAFLHQKEIVLNASDTENLLTAVQMIRDISGQLEANAMTMKYIKTLENYGTKVNIDGQTLQQDVTIHAEFPNATNHSEIEEAFKNLTNLASQYTNRKN